MNSNSIDLSIMIEVFSDINLHMISVLAFEISIKRLGIYLILSAIS